MTEVGLWARCPECVERKEGRNASIPRQPGFYLAPVKLGNDEICVLWHRTGVALPNDTAHRGQQLGLTVGPGEPGSPPMGDLARRSLATVKLDTFLLRHNGLGHPTGLPILNCQAKDRRAV